MGMFVTLEYVCKSEVLSPFNVGADRTLVTDCSLFNVLQRHTLKARRYSRGGQRFATNVRGRYRTGRLETPWILPENVRHWLEFFESVQGDEHFTINAADFEPVYERFECFIPDDAFVIPRVGLARGYRAAFNFRTIDELGA